MKKRIVLSSLLVIVMLFNGFCLPAAFAEDTEATAASAALTRPVMHEPVLVEPGVVELSWEDMSGVNDAYTIVFWDGEQKDAISGNRYNVEKGIVYGFMRMNVIVEAYGPNDYETFTYTSDIVYYYEPDPSVTIIDPIVSSPVENNDGSVTFTWTDGNCSDSKFALVQTLFAVTKDGEYQGTIDVTNTNTYTLQNISSNSLYEIKVIYVWVYFGHVLQGISEPIFYHAPETLGV